MLKRLRIALIPLVLLLVTACGGAAPAQTSPAPAPTPAPAPAAPAPKHTTYPLTVKDSADREVTLQAAPQRILSLAPSNTEIIWALGKGSWQVGRTDYCDYPPEAKTVESVGGMVDPSVEKMAALKPDLVLMTGGSTSTKLRDKLTRDLHMTVYVADPQNFEQVYASIRQLGVVLDAQDAAGNVVADMQAKVKAIADKTGSLSGDKKPKVFYEVWDNPLMTAGPDSFIDDMIRLAGGVNIGAQASERWAKFSLETLAAGNPDIIISPNQKSVDALKARQRKGWENLKAVKDGSIALVPDQNLVSRPGPRLVQGLAWFARTVHPELFQ